MLIEELEEEKVNALVRDRINLGEDPFLILDQCQKGMQGVGKRYENGIYFISGLIIAGEIMNQVAKVLGPVIENSIAGKDSGRVVIGTVEGDIHNIGKDLLKVLLRSYGFTLHDIGVDVSPAEFVEAAKKHRPDIIGLSCLISTCYDSMKDTIAMLKENFHGPRPAPVYIIGGRVDEQVLRHCDADFWANDAMTGVRLCQLIIKGR